jgi:hypothetical protein
MDCRLCGHIEEDLKRMSNHMRSTHGLSSEQYTVEVLHGGVRPTCPVCGSSTRYVSFSFKEYCKDHSRAAMAAAGARGGAAPAWNRGKTKENDSRLAAYAAKVSGTGNHFHGRSHTQETIRKISEKKTLVTSRLEERTSERSAEFVLLTPPEEYRSRQRQYLEFRCIKCGEVQRKTLQAFERGSRCYKCHPRGKSNWELSVFDFVKSITPDAVSGDKSVLSPKEVDVYVPSKKFGIECHGLFWHSEVGNPDGHFDRNSHQVKSAMAEERGIRLLQVFEDEWRDKRTIVESMIRHRLGLHSDRCKTWSTSVVELTTEEQKAFFDSTHISGYTPSKVCWGLKDRVGRVVSALSLRRPRHGLRYENSMEVARFSNALGLSVPGGLSKLLKVARAWSASNGYSRIMTYVDRRVGNGAGYSSAGFQKVGSTGPDYWYTDNELRYDRFKFRARSGVPEKQVALDAGVSRIYGCGSYVYSIDV